MNPFLAKLNPRLICVASLIIFSGAYTTKAFISPIYLTSLVGLIVFGCISLDPRFRSSLKDWAELLVIAILLIAICVMQATAGSSAPNIFNFILGPIVMLISLIVGRSLSEKQLIKISRWHIAVTVALISVECIYRLTHPDFGYLEDAASIRGDVEDIAFYAYKFNSFMYIDSNFVGLQLAILFAFACGLQLHHTKLSAKVFILIIFLAALTISRASLFTIFATGAFLLFKRMNGPMRTTISLLCALGAVATFYQIQQDASFLTKFDILNRFIDFLAHGKQTDILLGVGAGQASKVLGIGAHNIVVSYGTEIGLLGSLAILLYWIWMASRTAGVGLIFLAWLINGFSLTTLAIPYLYAAAAMLRLLQYRRKQDELNAPMGPK